MLADQGAAEEAGARHDDGRQDQRQRGQLRPRPPGQHGGQVVVVIERADDVEIIAVAGGAASASDRPAS